MDISDARVVTAYVKSPRAAAAKAATAVVNLVIGIAITSLLSAVAARAIRRVGPPGPGYRQREYTRRTEYVPTQPIGLPESRTPGHWE